MVRDIYEMTSPMRVLSYALRVATYIPPTVCLHEDTICLHNTDIHITIVVACGVALCPCLPPLELNTQIKFFAKPYF